MSSVLANLTAFALLLGVAAYSVAGGVDFGAGIWDLLAGTREQGERARALIDHAMAPVWEANNVWLVLSIVVCWTGFPLLFESAFEDLYPLYAIALVGVILRGAFFAFRHVAQDPRAHRTTGLVFGLASVLTPFFFAATLGAIASGRVHVSGSQLPVWEVCLSPMSIAFGLVSVAATAFIGATFLVGDARRSGQPQMVSYFRRRAVAAALVLIAIGSVALITIRLQSPTLLKAMFGGPGLPFALATVVFTPTVAFLLTLGVYFWYRVFAVAAVGSLVFAWGFAQSPYLLPGQLTIADAAAPFATQVLLLLVTVGVVLLIGPSLALLVYLDQRSVLQSPEG